MLFGNFFTSLPQHETLRAIVLMRATALLCQLLGLATAHWWLDIDLQLAPLLTVMALTAAFNVWTWRRMQALQPAGNLELFVQLLADIAALSILLYCSGGATNPFASFYLPVLAVAAALLPWRYALLLAGLAVGCYSLMTEYYVPLRMNDPDRAIAYHLAGMWVNFAASAALITWFVARLSRTLRQRDAQLAAARERHLEHERLIALGVQAANAAHEIGTPLSTVAVIAGELVREAGIDPALSAYLADFTTVETQIALCKAALQRMGEQARAVDDVTPALPIAAWLKQFVDTWRLRCPAARLELTLDASQAHIDTAHALAQILTTVLDNAAQAAAADDAIIRISLSCESDSGRQAVLQVTDNGAGIAPDLRARLGYQPVHSHSGGQGIGLLLAFAAARQIGASIALTPNQPRGTRATITIPLAARIA